jgi:hypothetical protein
MTSADNNNHTSANTSPEDVLEGSRSFAVYVLSRGRGVPEGALEALSAVRARIQGPDALAEIVSVVEERIGLEGETRVCLEFASAEAAKNALLEVQKIVGDQELVHILPKPCRKQ